MIIVETCPKCGHDLRDLVIATYPSIPQKKCFNCGWSWTGEREEIVRVPFSGNRFSPEVSYLKTCLNEVSKMKIDVHIIRGAKLVNVGYIEMEEFNADRCYDICNWRRWTRMKPSNLYADIESCDKVCFTNPVTKRMHLAKTIGWLIGNKEEINDYIQQNANESLWL